MSDVIFELNPAGVHELLTSSEMAEICRSYAEAVKGEYGDGAEVDVYVGPNRVNASVYQPAGRFDNDLLKAVGKVGGSDD